VRRGEPVISCNNPFGEKENAFMSRNTTSALLSAWAAIALLLAASCSSQPATPVQTADTVVQQPASPDVTDPVEAVEPDETVADVADAPAELEQPADEPLADPTEMLADPLAKNDLPSIDLDSMDDLFFGLDEEAIADSAEEESRRPDVIFVPTPQEVVDRMLELAQVTKDDLVYDLGCGDGRIVATAAKRYGCRAKGFDIDPQRVKESLATVKEHGVEDLVEIQKADIFTLDLSDASVVTLYLLPDLNVRLIPQLEKLKPGSRIVSHAFDMRGVKPDKVETVEGELGSQHTVYLWTTPLKKDDTATSEDDY
jgi:SAM-dependent methyltransferase